jgi:hypothetical protein
MISDLWPNILIPTASAVGVIFALILWKRVANIKVAGGSVVSSQNGRSYLLEEEQRGDDEVRHEDMLPCIRNHGVSAATWMQPCDPRQISSTGGWARDRFTPVRRAEHDSGSLVIVVRGLDVGSGAAAAAPPRPPGPNCAAAARTSLLHHATMGAPRAPFRHSPWRAPRATPSFPLPTMRNRLSRRGPS